MRVVQHPRMNIGEVDVSRIVFDARSRDDIPKILRGLQHLYTDTTLRTAVSELLTSQIAPKVNKENGRPRMTLWSILVCGVVRLDLNIDYDHLQELVNQHATLHQMLGHGDFDKEPYAFQTLNKLKGSVSNGTYLRDFSLKSWHWNPVFPEQRRMPYLMDVSFCQ